MPGLPALREPDNDSLTARRVTTPRPAGATFETHAALKETGLEG
jgi:hypothetical protein